MPRRTGALLCSAAVLASLSVATVANPASAAKPKCQGATATIVGTAEGERIVGTAGRDVIVARGGHDRIYGRGGNDLICAGTGNDLVVGGPGADTVWGQLGNDRLEGGPGNDFLAGQIGNDTINGGINYDTCYQGTGTGAVLNCELPAPPPPPAPTLIPMSGILAVAFSDIDGLDGYSTGDVLIARLRDTSGDGQPGAGDTVEMGRYPLNLDATAFGEWTVKSHVAAAPGTLSATRIGVIASPDANFEWVRESEWDFYQEWYAGTVLFSATQDGLTDGLDTIQARAGSPSAPQTIVDPEVAAVRRGDQGLIDVVLNWAP